jgi:hypothetical protein
MRWLRCLIVLVASTNLMHAGYLEYQENGEPFRWSDNNTISWVYENRDFYIEMDNGDLIDNEIEITASDVLTIIQNAIGHWDGVDAPALTFGTGTESTTNDINQGNYQSYINVNNTSCPLSQTMPGQNFAFVVDHNGAIFSALLAGTGIPVTDVLGIASPSDFDEDSGEITCGYVLINAVALEPSDADKDIATELGTNEVEQRIREALEYVITHELGHALNMVHSQINGDLTTSEPDKVPTMYPFIPSDPSAALATPLKRDDQFSYLYLYNQDQLDSDGGITGTVMNRFDQGVLGANVICRDVNDPLTNVVSWISDANLNGNGDYVCGHLPAGDYQVSIEPITVAINAWQTLPPFIASEFFNEDESFDPAVDNLETASPVAVANATIENIDLVLNENGRLISGIDKAGSINTADSPLPSFPVAPFEYYLYIPKNADTVTFELQADNNNTDIDLLGRCGQPFTLDQARGGAVFASAGSSTDQTQFASLSLSGSESAVLTRSSNPPLPDDSQCHIVVANLTGNDTLEADFTISATVEGKTPNLTFEFTPRQSVQDNGQTLTAQITAYARGDRFTVSSITFTDEGSQGLSDAVGASLYLDENGNGRVDDEDRLLGTTSAVSATQVTLNVDKLFFLDEENQTLLLTYELPMTASPLVTWLSFSLLLLLLMVLQRFYPKARLACWIVLLAGVGIRCSSSGPSDFQATITQKSDIEAMALGFGDTYEIRTDSSVTVQDFFDN